MADTVFPAFKLVKMTGVAGLRLALVIPFLGVGILVTASVLVPGLPGGVVGRFLVLPVGGRRPATATAPARGTGVDGADGLGAGSFEASQKASSHRRQTSSSTVP